MKDEEIRMLIAEVLGWKRRQIGSVYVYYQEANPEAIEGGIPNFCKDLNAMHKAENYICDQRKLSEYESSLCDICRLDGSESDSINDLLNAIRATARQRAEAFLRTLGKWKDDSQSASVCARILALSTLQRLG